MDYSLNTPIKRQVYVPDDVPFAPVFQPKPPAETDQSHRKMTWLFHRPQDHAVFLSQPESARDKKK
jgi:hypothetical protein